MKDGKVADWLRIVRPGKEAFDRVPWAEKGKSQKSALAQTDRGHSGAADLNAIAINVSLLVRST
jgi:hypothetical protein